MSFASPRLIGTVCILGVAVVPTLAATDPKDAVNDRQFHDKLLAIARIYGTYGRVDDEARWAPWLCRMPNPGRAYASKSTDEATHGQKLYSLFARDRLAYVRPPKTGSAVGQVIVKESWVPEEIKGPAPKRQEFIGDRTPVAKVEVPAELASKEPFVGMPMHDHFYPYAEKNGKVFKAGKKGDLFIMFKVDPKTPGTDDGWVYGTVTADGKKVTSAGRVASCMKCHETRKERLFGLGQKGGE